MKTKKSLSILLALMMMLSVVPFYASAAETLTASNIQTLPTITMKENVTVYTGNYQDTVFSVADDEVVVDAAGNQVAGHFVIKNSGAYSAGEKTVKYINLTFMPDDAEVYTSFNKNLVKITPVTFTVEKADLALKDAENDYPKTTEAVPSGTAISDIIITGGAYYIVQAPTTTTYVSQANWTWQDTSLIVTESGYYNAIPDQNYDNFNDFVVPVYIEVESNIEATTIVEAPTATIEYGTAWNEVVFEGGKVMAGDTEVSGTFTRKSTSTGKPSVGVFNAVQVIFTPDDLEKYAPCEGTAVVTVTKGNYKLVNENGEEIVPELTLPYGTTFDTGEALGVTLKLMIKDRDLLSGADAPFISFPDHDTEEIAPVGTNTYTVRIYPSHEGNSNYQTTYRQFVLTIEPVVITTTASWGTDGVIGGKLSHKAKGTLDVFVDGKLVADDIKAGGANNEWSVDYPIPATGDYTIKVVYNPTENDPYSMVDFEKVVTAKIRRSITYADATAVNHKINGDERTPIAKLGDTIELSTFGGVAFLGWKITDASGNEVDLGIADLTATEITFTMPDCDLFVEAMYQKDEPADDNGGLDIDNIFGDLDLDNLTQGDSDNPIVNIFNNIIAFFKNIIVTITELFRSIGDNT